VEYVYYWLEFDFIDLDLSSSFRTDLSLSQLKCWDLSEDEGGNTTCTEFQVDDDANLESENMMQLQNPPW
jgi:hypothetical protein